MEIESKYALITGGSSGIGSFLTQRLVNAGYTVFITIRQLHDIPLNSSENMHALLVDVRNEEQIKQAYYTLTNDFGIKHLDLLINNAGIVIPGAVSSISAERINEQFDVNVTGVLRLTKQFLPLLKAGNGKIINTGSMSSRMAIPFAGSYGASKAALKQLSWALRLELKPWNIGVFHLELGNFKTPIWEKAFKKGAEIDDPGYKTYMEHAFEVIKERSVKTNDPDLIWKAVRKIISHKNRKFNWVIGRDAKQRRFLTTVLPTAFLERILTAKFKLQS